MSAPRTYTRPMGLWWQRLPFYRRYLLREATCAFVIGYALMLLFGLWRLGQGRAAFEAWRAALAAPASLVFHAFALVAITFHAWTWFEVMPKTLPYIRWHGRRVADSTIVRGGLLAAGLASLLVLALAWGTLT